MTSTTREEHSVDAVVLGLGSAGEQIAKRLAAEGWGVIGFEPLRVGGICPFVACVPSKGLLYDANTGSSWPEGVRRRDELVDDRDDAQHADGVVDAGVALIRERAQIVDARTVQSDGHRVTADHVIIATGAAPVKPDIEGADRDSVWTSDDALSSDELPDRLVIIGGGAIGSELAEVYSRFGSFVTVLEENDVLTDDAEPEVSAALVDHLEHLGVTVRLRAAVVAIEPSDDGERDHGDAVRLDDGTTYPADRVLLAVGAEPRLADVGLQAIGLDADSIEIGGDCAVAGFDWLWAAGDVTPDSHWTHGASIQARMLTDRLRGHAWDRPAMVMPRCVFTNPPLGVVGETAASARARGVDAIVGRAAYTDTVRASTDRIETGVAAIVVDARAGAILGASIFGPRADDIIQIVTAFMASGADVRAAHRTVFPFPTFSQVVEVALDDAVSQLDDHSA